MNRLPSDCIALLQEHREPVLALLARVLWADRRMAPGQVETVTAACELLGESEPARLISRRPSEGPFGIPHEVGPLALAMAAWVAASDGRTHQAELALLDSLVDELGLDAETAARMHVIGLGRATLTRSRTPEELERVLHAAQSWLDQRPRAA